MLLYVLIILLYRCCFCIKLYQRGLSFFFVQLQKNFALALPTFYTSVFFPIFLLQPKPPCLGILVVFTLNLCKIPFLPLFLGILPTIFTLYHQIDIYSIFQLNFQIIRLTNSIFYTRLSTTVVCLSTVHAGFAYPILLVVPYCNLFTTTKNYMSWSSFCSTQ